MLSTSGAGLIDIVFCLVKCYFVQSQTDLRKKHPTTSPAREDSMCQTNIVLRTNGDETTIAENASFLEITPEGVTIGTLFEQSKLLKDVAITKIDFMEGRVYLSESKKG